MKLSQAENEEVNRIVKRYNERVRRAYKSKIPKSQLPPIQSARLIKKSYSSKKELKKELLNLASFTAPLARLKVTDYVTGYDYEMLKANRKEAIKYWERRAKALRYRVKIGALNQKSQLATVERNIDILKKPVKEMTEGDISAAARYVEKYRLSFERQATGYRGFLSEVEFVMRNVGISRNRRNEFFNKLSELTPDEFYDLYDRYDLIGRIYDLADSPKYGEEMQLNLDEDSARELIESLLKDIDVLIKEVKYER